MALVPSDPLVKMETTCGTLLYELQIIWDEVGESETERDKMLLELERECLEVYRRRVDHANKCRAQLRQAIAEAEAELAAICSAMGERPVHIRQSDQNHGSLKEELGAILPQVEEMRKRKGERANQFFQVLEQTQLIRNEIYGSDGCISTNSVVDDSDLSLRKLEQLQIELHKLQKEKSDRLKQVIDHLTVLHSLCLVLGIDFEKTVSDIHPSLVGETKETRSIGNATIEQLEVAIHRLRESKLQRMQRLQDLASTMLELWNLMDTPIEEQQLFQNVTCNIAASEDEITEPNMLSVEFINYVEAEVSRLEELKTSKMKELVLKKRSELEEICRKTHLIPESDNSLDIVIEAIESGAVDAASVLEQIGVHIGRVKEESLYRKDILEKVEKWMVACEEECWLEEYNRDDNRYNAGRGAHLTLKRAEKARALVNKLPAMVEALATKTRSWEDERGMTFTYDGIPVLSMLEEYKALRHEKEEEHKRLREQKKLQGQLIAEQEALYGSKPSPMKNQSAKKGSRMSCGGASSRRLSLGGTMLQTPSKHDMFPHKKATPNTRQAKKNDRQHHDDGYATLSAGRRGLDIAGLPEKKHSYSTRDVETPFMRKPFSPISSTDSSRSNATNILQELNRQHDMLQKTIPGINTPFATPTKTISTTFEEENRTPHLTPSTISVPLFATPSKTMPTIEEEKKTPQSMAIPIPSTPSTVSVPMQTAITPAHPVVPQFVTKLVVEMPEESIEYSFEERRAGFVLPRTHSKAVQI